MNKKIIAVIGLLVFSAPIALADISADIKSGLSFENVFKNAVSEGMDIADAVHDAVMAAPESVCEIVAAAIEMFPERAGDIVAAAVSSSPDAEVEIIRCAIAAGADPTEVTAAAAAGRAAGETPSPASFDLAPAMAPFLGAGGGGVASPS